MNRVIVITGASSGIGMSAAREFLRCKDTVISLSRRPSVDDAVHIPCDISEEENVKNAFVLIDERFGHIDLLINNAGYGISGAAEYTDIESAKRLFNVSYFGLMSCVKYALPLLRKSGRPMIINISSLAAVMPVPFQSVYSAAKAAVCAQTLCLANELRSFGIRVCALLPGDVKTAFTEKRDKSICGSELYGDAISRAVGKMESDEKNGMLPEIIARSLVRLSGKKHPKPLSTVGTGYKLLFILSKLLPVRTVNYLEGRLYG